MRANWPICGRSSTKKWIEIPSTRGSKRKLFFFSRCCDDSSSPNFRFEKTISGMYMGELTRRILLKLIREKLMFGGKTWDEVQTKDRFRGHYVGEIVT